ncbi:gamma-glutamyl phosphate reductase GPR [Eremomyces bilateralis CBS 781.70]|uniref:glutamate-5-semialdehyde dehydrogenase n=1 Tax=Eremomyces bilateralis CBS 781.70 TaxID=1392243 RepID=A0A6G1FYB8_9PEZI|nr:gamma-glutamyl phosphate reductase GPR [Eremomyces bilateralis CBS 781.70]KAF1810837.1 gamma-glutamyl phosphate reductase GPR [Eremomyces bilateralis CBS 781.70]
MSLSDTTPLNAAIAARQSSRQLAILPTSARNDALTAMHYALSVAKDEILAANAEDMQLAEAAVLAGSISPSLMKRLDLGKKGKYADMLNGILSVRDLEDPVGKIDRRTLLDEGLTLERISCPIGVLLIIFEARPEVIANIASLAIKSGNAAILKGGKESTKSFIAISRVLSAALETTLVPSASLQLLTTRDAIIPLLGLDTHIDLVVPRGSNDLVRHIKSHTQIPVLGHADGLCSAYLRPDYPAALATRIILDAKTSYPAACNSLETLLVDEACLLRDTGNFLPVASALLERGVELRCDAHVREFLTAALPSATGVKAADENRDFDTEFLDLTLAVKTIPSGASAGAALATAMEHINKHGSHHTDVILTLDEGIANGFLAGVDSAGVFWNTSSRLADGQRYGFGTEVGISTNKIHARGPVGLEGLTIYKWVVKGNGQVSEDYGEGEGKKPWLHRTLPVGEGSS